MCKNKNKLLFHEYILILGAKEDLPEEVTFMLRPQICRRFSQVENQGWGPYRGMESFKGIASAKTQREDKVCCV